MKKLHLGLGVLLLSTLLMPLQANAGSILLGDEPSFKGWEGRREMDKDQKIVVSEPAIAKEQVAAKSTEYVSTQRPYVGLGGGISIFHDSDVTGDWFTGTVNAEYDLGYGFNVVAGYNFNPIRMEAEFGYKVADIDKLSDSTGSISVSGADLTIKSYMVNGYYDVKTSSQLMPFFGVGIGMINGEADYDGDSVDDTVFGYQLTAGITNALDKNINLDCYYRFQGTASDFEKYGTKVSYNSSNVFLGMRFNF